MCGIAGVIGVESERSRAAALRMQKALLHRGPDDRGFELVAAMNGPPVALVHTRLAIVELSSEGHQPMFEAAQDELRANVVVFNGEIYNHGELRPELERAGFPCRTRSDTEVILNGYRAWGPRVVERLEGMFAFALFDRGSERVFFARDRVGIKPLYFHCCASGGFLFASEVRALLAAGPELVPCRLHRPGLEAFLAQGAVASEASLVEGVRLLPPGECLWVDTLGRPERSVRYWSVDFGTESGADTLPADGSVPSTAPGAQRPLRYRSEVVAELAWALRRAVDRLMLADVPVGLFLSSGVDSSSIATLATEARGRTVRSTAVGFDQRGFDESEGAARIAAELGTEHSVSRLAGEDVLGAFDDVLGAMDQPTVDGFNTYFVSKAARGAGLTVALSGLGGDELFGGYQSFRDLPRARRLSRPFASRRVASLGSRLSSISLPLALRNRALTKGVWSLSRAGDLVGLYFLRRELFLPDERRALHELPNESDADTGIESGTLETLRHGHATRDDLDRIAFLEFSSYMRHMLLRDADVFSMAHALEVRVPLLEHYVVERAAAADSRLRRSKPGAPKPLLLSAVGPRLPELAYRTKKRGFTFPWQPWLRGALRERARAAASARDTWRSLAVEPAAVASIFSRFDAGDRSLSALQILAFVVLEDFARRHALGA